MFTDKPERDGSNLNKPKLNKPPSSTIGEDLTITGNVTSKGEIHLDGQVQGDIHCVSLILGENAQLNGSVVAEDVEIHGCVTGSIRALRITLHSKGHVDGDLIHQSLAIEQGAHFEGKSSRSDDPLALSQDVHLEKPHPAAEDAEERKEKPAKFVRSLSESRNA
jgi:cytoskeletal protein CcmA (bactofilin family)